MNFFYSSHANFIVSVGMALHNVKCNCINLRLLQYVCAGVVVCMFMHEYTNQPAFTLKFPYYFLSSAGCSIACLSFSCLEH